jgi:outer membrane receptor protein involved in Fe transport
MSQGSQWNWYIHDTLTKPVDHDHLLPHLHVRFKATDWWDIRVSYNNTLSRPDYHHAVPIVYYHEINGSSKAGNPYIKPAVSENIDANFMVHPKRAILI